MEKIANKKKHAFSIKVITAICGSFLCGVIFLKAPLWGTAALISFATALAGFEMTVASQLVSNRFLQVVGIFFSAAIPWLVYLDLSKTIWMLILFLFVLICFGYCVFFQPSVSIGEVLACAFAAFVFPMILSLFVVINTGENGRKLVLLPLVIAWMCDAFSQIVGMKLGKHKLIETISPNKTVEGFIGGIAGSVLGVVIYALILQLMQVSVNWFVLVLVGVLGAFLAVFGDLSLSYIKRKCGIKDFGRLIPEHGGVLDRFDSVMFVLPLCIAMSQYIIK